MTLTPPIAQPIEIPTNLLSYRPVSDISPFTYRSGMTYQALLEGLRVYVTTTLTQYLADNFDGFEEAWENNLSVLINAVNTALATQRDEVAANLAETLAEIIAGANAQLNDGNVLSALKAASSQSLAYLDGRFVKPKRLDTMFFDVATYGAVGDGVTDDRAAIQATLDAAATAANGSGHRAVVSIGTLTYALGAVDYKRVDGSTLGAVSLMLPSNVTLRGRGTLKVKSGAYGGGAFYRMISSKSDGISNSAIFNITCDGNTAAMPASVQCGNIGLIVTENVDVVNVTHVNANGVAIAIGGASGTALARNSRVSKCRVLAASDIGIQVSRFNGLTITDNVVVNTVGNAIDIYGENGDAFTVGYDWVIDGNIVKNTPAVGIFPETVSRGRVSNNIVEEAQTAGIQLNRINGMPHSVSLSANTIMYCPRGIAIVGDMQDIVVHDNVVIGSSIACVQLGWGGNVSGVLVQDNLLNGADKTVPRILVAGTTASNLHTRRNKSRFTDGFTDVTLAANAYNNNIFESNQGVRAFRNDNMASGAVLSIVVPPNTAGKFTLYAESGGGYQSIWQGVYVCSDTKVTFAGALAANAAPAAAIGAFTTDGGRTVNIQLANTGSPIAVRYTFELI